MQIVDAQRIVDRSVVRDRRVVERGAVLRYIQRDPSVALRDPLENVGEALREDVPSELGVRRARVGNTNGTLDRHRRIELRDAALVVVDAEEVEGLAKEIEIRERDLRPGLAEHLF